VVTEPTRSGQRRLLVLSDDEKFWQSLLTAATLIGRKLVRERAMIGPPDLVRLGKPAVVVVDLDLPSAAGWNAADSLLREANCPPVLLVISRGDQVDISTAVQAGSLIDKSEHPTRLLELADTLLGSSEPAHRHRNAIQQIVIRWLKPCNWSPEVIPLRRSLGINE
jgi:DNA-binding response OmpR family regulator